MCIDNSLGPHVDWFPNQNPWCPVCNMFRPANHICVSTPTTTGVLTFNPTKVKPFNAEREFLACVVLIDDTPWLKHYDTAMDEVYWISTSVKMKNWQIQEAFEQKKGTFLKRVLPTKTQILEDFLEHKDVKRVTEDLEYV